MNQEANISNAQTALLTKKLKGERMGKSILRFSLSQIYPPYSESTNLNVCGDPDCGNYGKPYNDVFEGFVGRNGHLKRMTASLKNSAIGLGVGSYKLNSRGDKENIRNSSAFEYEGDVHSWSDNRSMKCQHHAGNAECGIKLMILSNEHFEDELDRLTSQNDLLTGPRCGHCGTSYLSAPGEFAFNGANGKKVGPKGKSKAICNLRSLIFQGSSINLGCFMGRPSGQSCRGDRLEMHFLYSPLDIARIISGSISRRRSRTRI